MEKRLKLKIRTVIFGCSILFISFFLIIFQNQDSGSFVCINIDGNNSYYLLNNNQKIVLNDGSNVLVIKDGYAYMDYADCPDKICIKQGKINKNGQTISCLPNKISISISNNDDVDIVSN